jgi:hypothetical protein
LRIGRKVINQSGIQSFASGGRAANKSSNQLSYGQGNKKKASIVNIPHTHSTADSASARLLRGFYFINGNSGESEKPGNTAKLILLLLLLALPVPHSGKQFRLRPYALFFHYHTPKTLAPDFENDCT